MDFEMSQEHSAFREMVHKWVDKEVSKSWARELERDEHNYPFALWEKFTDAGFHGIGIAEEYGGQGGDVVTQMILAREFARTSGGWPGSGESLPSPAASRSAYMARPSRRRNSCRKSPPASYAPPSHSPNREAAPTCSAQCGPKRCEPKAVGP